MYYCTLLMSFCFIFIFDRRRLYLRAFFKFVILDFEFSMIDHTSFVLISGAISNALNRYKIVKLEGNPLVLSKHGRVKKLTKFRINSVMNEMARIFKNNSRKLTPLLAQLYNSISSPLTTLNSRFIKDYLENDQRRAIIVLWSGDTDKLILDRLGIRGYIILNIICYDIHNNRTFNIQLSNLETKEKIHSFTITVDKSKGGRLLNLEETHGILCKENHNITYIHDPLTDVKFTKCLFDKIIKNYGYENLVNYLYAKL